jgi:cytochrome c oxidase subunit 3
MSAVTAGVERAAAARRDRKARRETAAFGMWVFLASEAMFFGGLFFAYAYGRLRFPTGFAAAGRATDVVIGTVNTGVLLSSSFLVALALAAAAQRRRRYVAPLLAATVLLGLVFLGLKAVEYHGDWTRGFFPGPGFRLAGDGLAALAGGELFCMLYFTMTGVHALHMAVGVGWMSLAAWGSWRRPAAWIATPRLEVAGLYWHFVDVIWIILYPLLYLVSRHA